MKETYLSRDFRETAAQCFPSQANELNAFFDARLNVLLAENADASKEHHRQRYLFLKLQLPHYLTGVKSHCALKIHKKYCSSFLNATWDVSHFHLKGF